ncbi:MAG: divergent PAP2 family protein [Zhaonellaceae bacterium]|jgi:acid phosphatase family membrane protein YuiD|nr:divergent PAP2 family protein [Clostridia bacterium]
MPIILLSSLGAWLLAQSIKFLYSLIRYKKIDFRKFISPGGMPSAHSALVSCVSTKVGLLEGFDSTLFSLSVVFSLIIMYDAAGVRHAAGKQAQILNRLVEDFYESHTISEKRLKELLGHTPIEVFIGMLLGISFALIF